MIQALMVVEMLGRPPERIAEAIKKHIGLLKNLDGVEVLKEEYSEPKEVEGKNVLGNVKLGDEKLHSCFCEVEFSCKDCLQLSQIVLDFMPSSVEVVEPSKVSLDSGDLTLFMNNLSGRLNRYDEVVRIMKEREHQFHKELSVARRLLHENGLVDENGKVVRPKGKEEESSGAKKDEESGEEENNPGLGKGQETEEIGDEGDEKSGLRDGSDNNGGFLEEGEQEEKTNDPGSKNLLSGGHEKKPGECLDDDKSHPEESLTTDEEKK